MKITLEFLKSKLNAYNKEFITFIKENRLLGLESRDLIKKLIELNKLPYANYLNMRIISYKYFKLKKMRKI